VSPTSSNLSHARVARLTACVLFASAFAPACKKPPKPRELQELDVMWQDPETRRIKDVPGARGYYDTARKFRVRAQEAYDDGDLDTAREYAVWSVIKYRTAEAIASQQVATERLNKANARIAKINPELTALNQERNKLIAEVGDLEIKVAQAKRAKIERERRAAALNSGGVNTTGGDDAAATSATDAKIAQVESAQQQALSVSADKHAAGLYNRANNMLNSIKTLRQNRPVPHAMIRSTADKAIQAFNDAAMKAKPGFKVDVAKQDPAARRAALVKDALAVFGPGSAVAEVNSVRVIAAESHGVGQTTYTSRGQQSIAAVVELSKKYDEFSITIEAYTSEGDATENLALSQLRARSAEDSLVAAGIPKSRITSSKGQGQDTPRYPGDRLRNERLEFVFR
jgi:outer membrane protein OmpA-like peptidoglycan-associated protein